MVSFLKTHREQSETQWAEVEARDIPVRCEDFFYYISGHTLEQGIAGDRRGCGIPAFGITQN